VKRQIRVILIKQNMDLKNAQDMATKVMITLFSLFAELERDIISLRTKEALANKRRKGVVLGKPRGTIQPSKFDKDLPRIKELLRLGLSAKKVAKVLEYDSASGLIRYIRTRNLKVA
jgi:Resolvase, N terminal domain.